MRRLARTLRLVARICSAAAAELDPPEPVATPASDEPSESLAIARRMATDMQVRRVMEAAFGPPDVGQA